MRSPSIRTNSGQIVDLLNPDPDTLLIEDIAHHLAGVNRFTGAGDKFYSVAQHSVLVSNLVSEDLAYEALLHDMEEAYLGDVSSPLKALLPDYRGIADNMYSVLAYKFGIPQVESPEVKQADMRAYILERTNLIKAPIEDDPDVDSFKGMLVPAIRFEAHSQEIAKQEFQRRFAALNNRRIL